MARDPGRQQQWDNEVALATERPVFQNVCLPGTDEVAHMKRQTAELPTAFLVVDGNA
jgi:hypothetical protein